jgi:murein DD-endopeptidase MepM/ murein hydrolase activator NlpD
VGGRDASRPGEPLFAMARRLTLLLALALVAAAPALAGDGLGQRKASVDAKLSALQGKIAAAHRRADALTTQIGGLTSQIRALEGRVSDVAGRLQALQADLALRQRRLDKLNELYGLQTTHLRYLRREYALSVQRLDERLVAIYKQDEPSTADVILTARSFDDLLDQLDYLSAIANQDKHVAAAVGTAKRGVRSARARTAVVRSRVQSETRLVKARVEQQAILRDQLLASRQHLARARAGKSNALGATRAQINAEVGESRALAAVSAQLSQKIRDAESAAAGASSGGGGSSASPPPSGSGQFIWPVSGPITSPFGPRWGSFHPGIDIGVPTGTPIHAAASGRVIYCGWMSGYGNLVMIDHGGGLATLYGHEERVAVSCGQDVSQGQVVGYSDCTGYCFGPHVHFEVRVNGSPVDPLGYL